MRLFRKFKSGVMPAIRAGWATRVSGRAEEVQSRLAIYLNGKTANLTARGKWVFLVLICLLFGGCSVYLLIQAFL